jgi:enamine deaminase RidA (YjgF/YER057c/UK114 family)
MIKRLDAVNGTTRAVIRNGLIYFGGHVANGKDITEQTRNLVKRYDELFDKFGTDKYHLLSATVYIRDIKLRDEMNAVWHDWIPEGYAPARVCVEVGLPDDYLLEVSVTAELIDEK